ncbi:MAG: acyltransferase family protein, partial [Microthrixaceae bacterium]
MSGPSPVVGAPPERRDAIDVARVLALLVVVLGHLLMAVIDRRDGEIRGANLLALHPGWVFVAALAPMPVFFAGGGWANATATLTTSLGRLRTLVGLSAVVVCAWSAGVILAVATTGHAGVVGDGARVATQPLWFVAAYAPLAAAGGWLARLAANRIVALVGASLALLTALDVARFALVAPEWIGWPGFYLAWGTPWLLGGWWRGRPHEGTRDARRGGGARARAG